MASKRSPKRNPVREESVSVSLKRTMTPIMVAMSSGIKPDALYDFYDICEQLAVVKVRHKLEFTGLDVVTVVDQIINKTIAEKRARSRQSKEPDTPTPIVEQEEQEEILETQEPALEPTPEVKPKKTRRTRAEMEAARAQEKERLLTP